MSRYLLSRRTFVAAGSALSAGLVTRAFADAPDSREEIIEGNVVYRERMMLPQGSQVEVQLADVSLADAPSTVLASTTVTDATASPVPFRLSYDPGLLEGGHRYALQARITHGDELLFINDTHHAFEPGSGNVEIAVVRVASAPEGEAATIAGPWLAEDIEGGGVIDNAQTTLEIADGRVFGRGGCNRYSGSAEIDGDKISFGMIVATQIGCVEAVMNQEMKFIEALGRVASFRIDDQQRKLFLIDAEGQEIVRLAEM